MQRKKRSVQDWRYANCKLSLTDHYCLVITHSNRLCRKHPAPLKPMSRANENSQRCVPSSRRASPNRPPSVCDSRDTENGCANSKADADTNRTQTATGLVNTDEDRVVHRLMERVQTMEAEMASLRRNEKSYLVSKFPPQKNGLLF